LTKREQPFSASAKVRKPHRSRHRARTTALAIDTGEVFLASALDQVLVSRIPACGAPISLHYRVVPSRDGDILF
jgi:hypothetical protein